MNMVKVGLQCLCCKEDLRERWQKKFCSNKCQANFQYSVFLKAWLRGKKEVITKNISGHIRRFLEEKNGKKCMCCGWDKVHTVTKRVPLEVDHKDGNSDNNTLRNLQLLCPNCHALTPSFRNLNRGKGRAWRKKYIRASATS
jgi:hypothetical protein